PLGVDGAVDNVSLSYIKVNYTKLVAAGDFEKEMFMVPQGESRPQIPEAYASYVAYDITNIDQPIKSSVTKNGNTLVIAAGNPNGQTNLLVQQSNDITRVNLMEKARFRNVLQQPSDYIIITNELLRRPSLSYGDP